MFIDFYLKFESEEEAQSVLYRTVGKIDADLENGIEGNPGYQVPNFANIDILGTLYEKQDLENPSEPIEIPGYHCNIRVVAGEDGSVLEPYKVNPEPLIWRRMWA